MTVLPRVAAAVAVAVVSALSTTAAGAAGAKVHITGTAYEFNNVKVKLGGATVKVAEIASASATVKADGTYDLVVPAGKKVTPYIVADGYRTVYLQTFSTVAGEDLEHVNIQTPSLAVAGALSLLLSVPVDAAGLPQQCVIVSTFSTRNVRGLGVEFSDFTGYGAHGVAGATASAKPALPAPTYFNDQVLPDPNQKLSSVDGGVIWTGVAAGAYTVSAKKTGTRFASFTATCANGRIVNANPPWGLHELGLKNTTVAKPSWSGQTLTELRLNKLPKGSTVSLGGKSVPVRGAAALVIRSKRTLTGKRPLELRVTAPAYDGLVLRFTPRASGAPVTKRLCLPLGNTLPRPSC
ncbi:MAG: hypothetical protein V9E83_11655 [Baekduia sp.]